MALKKIAKTPPPKRGEDGSLQPGTSVSGDGSGARTSSLETQNQYDLFARAMRFFHSAQFEEAKEVFERAAAGPSREVAHRAGLHVRMCERRLVQPALALQSQEDHYNYAVALINLRNLSTAQQHLETALRMDSQADHVYYALAACRALSGDVQGAYENLKRAIDLQPRNRVAARQDDDFSAVLHQPPLERLLFPERHTL